MMSIKDVELVYGQPAHALLSDHTFLTLWRRLLEGCSYATAFQTPGFVGAWYEAYRSEWQPLIALSRGPDRDLVGLWFLAHDSTTGTLVHAGTDQAEYQTWLALPGEDASFLSAAWRALRLRFRVSKLQLKYLPAAELVDTLQRVPGMEGRVIVSRHRRPLLTLDPADLKASFAKKSNKSRFNRLKKLGPLEFRRITDPVELERVLDELIAYYDLRHGAVHDSLLFRNDPHRRAFHAAMFAGLASDVYVTVTYLNGTPIAAFWGAASRKTVHLGMIVHSPVLAQHSPGKLHIMQLSELLLQEGREVLDLTPGDDAWKERFASAHDEVAEAVLYGSRWARATEEALQGLKNWGKRYAAVVGVTPVRVRETVSRLRRARVASVLRNIGHLICTRREFRVYRAERTLAEARHYDERVHCNALSDLVAFEPAESWQTRASFLSSALQRLERGESVYTVKIDDRLAHSGWLVANQSESCMTEVQQSLSLPPGSVLLNNFYTDPHFRGRGLYRTTIGHMLRTAFADAGTRYAYIGVLADNRPSRHVIEAAGLEYQRSYFLRRCLGAERKWVHPMLGAGE
jgi:CelD/BcsL family acetyltransferase involved in cellulose biosynthesis/RimJ/RimL family protein N-acetyltransferase